MKIKSSTALRSDYNSISELAHESGEPVYITKNGEGDLVVMSIDAFEMREQQLRLRERILKAEEERITGKETLSIEEARKQLEEFYEGV